MRKATMIRVWLLFFAFGLSAVARADVKTGLVAHWTFDETEGITAHDSSGNGHHGTLNGGPAWSAGYLHGALLFDGGDDVIKVPYSPALNPADAFTVMAWAKPSSSEWNAVISSRIDGPPQGYIISAESGRWNFGVSGSSGCNNVVGSPVTLQTWVHLAGVYSEGIQKFYVDGESVGESSNTLRPNQVEDLLIGAASSGPIPGGSMTYMFFSGSIDEVRLYNRALSASDVGSVLANDMLLTAFKANMWEDEYGEHTKISLVLPRNAWRYALEQCDTLCVWRRVNPTIVGADEGLGWNWTMDNPPRTWALRVAFQSRTPTFGELDVLVNPITTDMALPGLDQSVSYVSDDRAFSHGFRPLGMRWFWTEPGKEPQKEDHAMWMVKPSGGPYTGDRSPVCEVEFVKHERFENFWHLESVETGYVALGDYCGEEVPPAGSPNRPVAVREDLVCPVGVECVATDPLWSYDSWEAVLASKRPSEYPDPQDAKLFDPGRVFFMTCYDQHLYMLKLPLPQWVRSAATPDELIAFGPSSKPGDFSAPFTSHLATVPYTEVKDPRSGCDREWQRQDSPFYTLEREEAFQLVQKATGEGTFEYTDTQGTSTEVTQTYRESSAFTVSLDAGIGLEYKGASGTIAPGISVTKEMGWETSEAFSNMRERTVSYSATVRQGESAGIWFRCYRLIQRDARGQAVDPNPAWMVDPNEAVFTYWPPR